MADDPYNTVDFINLSIQNFQSFGNNITTVSLKRPGTTLITGQNFDDGSEGVGANGVGKSTLLNALTFAVYDTPVSKISKDNLVNNQNLKNLEVGVEFTAHNNRYKIIRSRKSKTGADVFLYENDVDITRDSAANTNAHIVDIIGVPFELFVRIVVFSATKRPYLDLSSKEQTEIIEELFRVTVLSKKAVALKDIIKETEGRAKLLEVKIESLERERERHTVQVQSAKRRVVDWEQRNDELLVSLAAKLKKIECIDVAEQKSLQDELVSVSAELAVLTKERRALSDVIESTLRELEKNKKELAQLYDDKCPYCLQAYVDAREKIGETEGRIVLLGNKWNEHVDKEGKVSEKVAIFATKISGVKARITVTNLDELLQIKGDSDVIRSKVEEAGEAVNPHLESLDELVGIKIEDVDYSTINECKRELEHQKFLLKLLTKKDSFVRRALLNKNIPFLNSRMQFYLGVLGLQHKVEFTHELCASITQFGRLLDFGNLSAGQQARVNLALAFSFRDVLESLHKKINICLLDEVLDVGLDAIGIQNAARLLKKKARDDGVSMFIISHREEAKGIFDHNMVVQMTQGFSYIKEEDV